MATVALAIVAYAGFALLALGQDRHWRTVTGSAPRPPAGLPLRVAGVMLVAAGLPVAVWHDGPAYGALLFGVMVSVAAAGVVVTLALLSRRPNGAAATKTARRI